MLDGNKLFNLYRQEIRNSDSVSFEKMRGAAVRLLKENFSESERDELYENLGRGKNILEREPELLRYLYSFGNMHQKKIQIALTRLGNLFDLVGDGCTIVDWGCGQALATVCFLDELRRRGIAESPERVVLVEPSRLALENGNFHIGLYGVKDVVLVNKKLDDVVQSDVYAETPVTVHLLSNILDVEDFDLKHLAQIISGSSQGEQYIVCVGPIYGASRRFEVFKSYFEDTTDLVFERRSQNSFELIAEEKMEKDDCRNFTMELLIFKFVYGESSVVEVSCYPPVQFFAAYELDCIRKNRANLPEEDYPNQDIGGAFEIMAPFEFGTGAYEDVHPVLAVLNNIIVRGLPTKCSPLIEDAFVGYGNKAVQDDLGTISYDGPVCEEKARRLEQICSPIGIARIQKTLLEAMICGRLSLNAKSWKILIWEKDVPCAALAIKDLQEMVEHIASLSKDYRDIKIPDVRLTVLSNETWERSPLHLGANVATSSSEKIKARTYDAVIEISTLNALEQNNRVFSEFKCRNACYFVVGGASEVRTTRKIYTSGTIDYRQLGRTDQFGAFEADESVVPHLEYFLNLLFRKRNFREGQIPILNRALQNKNVIGLLPTGGGKSLTYQLAAMLQPGVALVVDPLRSLMIDQYQGLIDGGIDACCYINSLLGEGQRKSAEFRMENSEVQFVFISPERLCIYEFREKLKAMHDMGVYFSYGVIDEVHCVSEWGHDFRFSYLHLGRNLYNYVRTRHAEKKLTLFGLTATASFDVLADVERELSGNGAYPLDANTVVRYENTDRLELQYRVKKVAANYGPDSSFDKKGYLDKELPRAVSASKWDAYNSKSDFLLDHIGDIPSEIMELHSPENMRQIKERFAQRQNRDVTYEEIDLSCQIHNDMFDKRDAYPQSGIVFCPHRESTGVSVFKNEERLSETIADIGTFVGSSDDKRDDECSFRNLELFKDNKQSLMVATKAFGMGIDKPNIRFTVNMNYPSSLESFVQEAGRAGRDRRLSLATVLVSDYRLIRISPDYAGREFPLMILKNRWFSDGDLQVILDHYRLNIPAQYIEYATPDQDWVRFECDIDRNMFASGRCAPEKCPSYDRCQLRQMPDEVRGWRLYNKVEEAVHAANLPFLPQKLRYLNPDYDSNMFFFNNNFKGEAAEKRSLFELLCKKPSEVFLGNDTEKKACERVDGIMSRVLALSPGEELVAFLEYKGDNDVANLQKAIYRLCCIGFIDDFTQDYSEHKFRLVMKRRPDGDYYACLKEFLTRYYADERAQALIDQVPSYKGQNEVQKCLGYLTEFIYSKIAIKRKRALDDMRAFCASGAEDAESWIGVNEELKDFIYYYFNSKYANEDYVSEVGEPFSLTVDTNWGKESSADTVLKYMRVVDDDHVGASGTPIDNVKHLQGAVRLVRRSLTDTNPCLTLLNFFCLTQLGTNRSEALEQEIIDDYRRGILGFSERIESAEEFWKFHHLFNEKVRSLPHRYDFSKLDEVEKEVRAAVHLAQLQKVTCNYLIK